MWTRVAVETVAAETAPVSLVMLEVGTLPRGASPMGSNAAATLDATHSAAARHLDSSFNANHLPKVVRPKFTIR